jgi:peroxiredoxin family protein
MRRPLVIFLSGAGWEARYQAVMLGVTAAALGDQVTLAVSFVPLRDLVAGRFDDGAPPTAPAVGVPPLSETLAEARRELGLRVVACETAIRLAGLEPEVARAALDGLDPLPSLWRMAQAGRCLCF